MITVDITEILSPDLKSRNRAHDFALYLTNTGEDEIVVDFANVKFATRSFIDEFYNLFLKTPSELSYRIEITNVPEDINVILESVSRTQTKVKVIPSSTPEKSFKDVDELLNYLRTASY